MTKTYGIAARCGSCGNTGYWELIETAHGPVCKTGDVESALAEKDEQIAKLKDRIKELEKVETTQKNVFVQNEDV